MTLAFWRSAFALAVSASARFPRLVPMAVVEFVDGKFYVAAMRETLARVEREEQRRSWAYGQVAMHDPTLTRAQVDAIADTMPAPWSCLAGDLEGHDAGTCDERDLHDDEHWRGGKVQRKAWEA